MRVNSFFSLHFRFDTLVAGTRNCSSVIYAEKIMKVDDLPAIVVNEQQFWTNHHFFCLYWREHRRKKSVLK